MNDTTTARTDDELVADVRCMIAAADKPVSISQVQKELRIGYNRAARLLELANAAGEPADPSTQVTEDPGTPPVDVIEVGSQEHGATFMLGKLMATCKKRFMNLAEPWSKLSQREQERVLQGLQSDVEAAVKDAIKIIAANARVTFRAQVEAVQFKGSSDVKASLKLFNSEESHALADVAGGYVTIVIEQLDELLAIAPDDTAGEPDNRPLFDQNVEGTALDTKPEAVAA